MLLSVFPHPWLCLPRPLLPQFASFKTQFRSHLCAFDIPASPQRNDLLSSVTDPGHHKHYLTVLKVRNPQLKAQQDCAPPGGHQGESVSLLCGLPEAACTSRFMTLDSNSDLGFSPGHWLPCLIRTFLISQDPPGLCSSLSPAQDSYSIPSAMPFAHKVTYSQFWGLRHRPPWGPLFFLSHILLKSYSPVSNTHG